MWWRLRKLWLRKHAPAVANVVLSVWLGSFAAFATWMLGSQMWWLWGLIFTGMISTALACVQVGAGQ
jgi:hypothetical protein